MHTSSFVCTPSCSGLEGEIKVPWQKKTNVGNVDCGKLSQQDNEKPKRNSESKNRKLFQNKATAILFSVGNLYGSFAIQSHLCDRNKIR